MDQTIRPRFAWVDYAKGICIVAVVMLYATGETKEVFKSVGWIQYWVDFAKPFRMPDFFLISGLFLSRVIEKPLRHYLDRKVIHYVYFYLLWSFLCFLLRLATGELHESGVELLKSFISMLVIWPFHQMWFILMLPVFFLAVRVTRKIPWWIIFPVACLINIFPPTHIGKSIIDDFGQRFVFFYAGYAFAPLFFSFADKVSKHFILSLLGLLVWIGVNSYLVFNGYSQHLAVALILGFAGACAVISVAALLQLVRGFEWLRYLGEHSIVIYLPFYWLMVLSSVCFVAVFPHPNLDVFTFTITITSILGSVVAFWLFRYRIPMTWFYTRPECFKLSP